MKTRAGTGPVWIAIVVTVLAGGVLTPARGLARQQSGVPSPPGETELEAAEVGASFVQGFESVRIELPASVTFYLTNLTVPTPATGPTDITFDRNLIRPGRALAISVRAEDRRFAAPFGPQIPIEAVTWRTSNASNGQGIDGALGRNWGDVFEGEAFQLRGGVRLHWTIAPPPPGLASGAHTVMLRWRLRAVNP